MTRPETQTSYCLFDTPIGACALAWKKEGLAHLQLPEATEAATEARLLAQKHDLTRAEPKGWVKKAVESIKLHLRGRPQDFTGLPLAMDGVPEFHRKVYEAARAIGSGKTMTYGELAARLGSKGASRAVGQALGRNPLAIIVPCHRVLAANGKPGGFSAYGGTVTKAKLLELEGASLKGETSTLTLFDGATGLPFAVDEAVRHVTAKDRPLARLVDKIGPFRLKLQIAHSPFEALTEAILHQQITGKAAAAIALRLRTEFGTPGYPPPDAILRAPLDKLRKSGLSGSKAAALKDLASKAKDGTLPGFEEMASMEDDAIVERLVSIRGIGRWTAEMLLIFRLGRPDVLPTADYGIRKGFSKVFRLKELATPKQIERRGERWRPYRTVASWYLWRSLDPVP